MRSRLNQARRAFGLHQTLVRVLLEMAEEGPVALGLALLGTAEHGVDLVHRLARQQAAQEHHRVGDGRQVGLKIAARDAEQVSHIAAAAEHGFGTQAVAVVDQRDHAGRETVFAEDAPDQVGAALAVEHGFQQLDGAHRVWSPMREVVLQAHGDGGGAAQAVPVRCVEAVVGQHALEGLGRVRLGNGVDVARDRMGDGVGRFDVDRHELDRIVHATGGEQPPGQGVVEGLVQLAVDQPFDQRGEGCAYLHP
jgi:hypothetical protein